MQEKVCERCGGALAEPRACEGCAAADRGRRLVNAAAVSVIGANVLLFFLGGMPGSGLAMQLVVFGLLFMQLFRGRAWARWIVVALTGLTSTANAAAALGLMGPGHPQLLSAGFAIVFGACALVLALNKRVAHFLRVQRRRHP